MHENLIVHAVASSATYRDAREEAEEKEGEREREEREWNREEQKESPGIIWPRHYDRDYARRKVDPFQCQGIVTRSRGGVLCAFRRFSPRARRRSGLLRLASVSSTSLRSTVATAQRDETLPAADAGGRATPLVAVGRVYGCGTIGYLLLCIWHIVKLIERDDKIAMFFDVKRGERLARERDRKRGRGEKKEREREKDKGESRELREGGGLPNLRQTERKREIEERRREEGDSVSRIACTQGEKRRAPSGAASLPRRCL